MGRGEIVVINEIREREKERKRKRAVLEKSIRGKERDIYIDR